MIELKKLRLVAISIWQKHGLYSPFILLFRFSFFFYSWFFRRNKRFIFNGKEYKYFIHLANVTFRCERGIEIPIGVNTFPLTGDILELGNVLNQYFKFDHDVVDKYEKDSDVINEDIITHAPDKRYDLILSLSTLEHVGWDETPREPGKLHLAFKKLQSLLKPGGKLLVTVPLGYNSFLDEGIKSEMFRSCNVHFMHRVTALNDWEETSRDEAMRYPYGSKYPCANGIAIIIYEHSRS